MRFPFAVALLISSLLIHAAEPVPGFKLPDGFEIHPFAGPELANDIHTLHIDSEGRVVVAGRGYVRQLIDDDADGRADRAVDLIGPPTGGPMGLLWEGETLYAVVDGGLQCYRRVTGKAASADKPTTILALKATGEHDAHAVKRGPDGALYLICGNSAGISAKTATDPASPVRDPVAGGWLRLDPKTNAVRIVADGLRNAYDFDFDSRGRAITFDSDNERCVGLPWYEPTRLYHLRPGGNYGWLNPQFAQSWRKPPDFPDVVAPILTAGRGSPTGVACYRHTAFPGKYRDGVFFADWTFGKIFFSTLTPKEDSLAGRLETFLESTGESGFAPTGLAVHPLTGDLYVATGGRGTRGGVYRIRATKPTPDAKPIPWKLMEEKPFARTLDLRVTGKDWLAAKTAEARLAVLRKYQLALGDVGSPKASGTAYEGYTFRKPADKPMWAELSRAFPTGELATDRELLRLFAAFGTGDEGLSGCVLDYAMKSTDPLVQTHTLIALSRLTAPLGKADTARLAGGLLALDRAVEKAGLTRDRHWPMRMREVLEALLARHTELASQIETHRGYGQAEHLWIAQTPGIDKRASAEAFVRTAKTTKEFAWSAGHVAFLGELPAKERRPILEGLLREGVAHDAIVEIIAQAPIPDDLAVLKKSLGSGSPSAVQAALRGLTSLEAKTEPTGWALAIQALRRFGDPKTDSAVRAALVQWLRDQTGQTHGEKVADWEAWLIDTHPKAAKALASGTGYDPVKWKAKLVDVEWEDGSETNGRKLFVKANCAACHNGGQAVGPSLEGVSKRFSRDDLLTAILDPNRDVPPRYRTTRVLTDEEKTYEGIIIYEATDGVILLTGAGSTVRIAGKSIRSQKPGTLSLMPTGLLDEFQPFEIADLLAYLKTLDPAKR